MNSIKKIHNIVATTSKHIKLRINCRWWSRADVQKLRNSVKKKTNQKKITETWSFLVLDGSSIHTLRSEENTRETKYSTKTTASHLYECVNEWLPRLGRTLLFIRTARYSTVVAAVIRRQRALTYAENTWNICIGKIRDSQHFFVAIFIDCDLCHKLLDTLKCRNFRAPHTSLLVFSV